MRVHTSIALSHTLSEIDRMRYISGRREYISKRKGVVIFYMPEFSGNNLRQLTSTIKKDNLLFFYNSTITKLHIA